MKKNRKVILTAVLVSVLAAAFSGCKKSDGTDQGSGARGSEQAQKEGDVYVPEYAKIDIKCNYIDSVAASGDTAFINAISWNEEEGSYRAIYKYDLIENKSQLLFEPEQDRGISGMALDPDGSLLVVDLSNDYTVDENGEMTGNTQTMTMRRISAADGTVMEEQEITDLMSGSEYMYVRNMCVDGQGNIYLYNDEGTIYVMDQNFQKLCEINTGNRWISSMAVSREGDVYAADDGKLKKIDLSAKGFGEAVKEVEFGWGNEIYTGISQSFLTSNTRQVMAIDIPAAASQVLFDWIDVDVNADNVEYVGELSDGRLWSIVEEYDRQGEPSFQLVYLTKKDRSEIAVKEEIVFGTMWLDQEVRREIVEFNKTNSQYRIVVREYGSDDYETGLIQFGADMTTANCPDIINLSQLDFAQFANKGVFEDLYPYMESSGLRKEDYLENILGAYEVDGGLYGIMPRFYISSIAAKSSLVGTESGWTLSEMLDLVEKVNPPYVMMYDSRDTMLWYCVYQDIDEFINWESGECFFGGEEFIRALEFAARFPGDDDVDYSQREGTETLLHENKVLLMQTTISSVQEYQMMRGMFGEDITYIGFPNKEKKGSLVVPASGSYGMSSKSKYKDGVWDFLKTFIEEEYQDGLVSEHGGWGFPVRTASLEKQFELDQKPNYYEDEEGNQIEQPKTTWGYNDFSIDIMAATQEEIDVVRNLISSADRISENADRQIVNIIQEEAEPFFRGQKSAADAAAVVQNRVQIYVNENR